MTPCSKCGHSHEDDMCHARVKDLECKCLRHEVHDPLALPDEAA